jgi:ubiquinol-cytochrome c reductase cytochrome b subunit
MFYRGVYIWPKIMFRRNFYIDARVRNIERIGPHSEKILSILIGSLLGNGHAEKRGNKTRIHFSKSTRNMEYLVWLHNSLVKEGYCKEVDYNEIKTRKIFRFSTYSFRSFNFLYEMFYDRSDVSQPISLKRLSYKYQNELEQLFTPLAFAVWFMDDGGYYRDTGILANADGGRRGIIIYPSKGFDYNSQIDVIREIISRKYNIPNSFYTKFYGPKGRKMKEKECIFFYLEDVPKLDEVIGSYVLPSLQYKFKLPEHRMKYYKRYRLDEDEDFLADVIPGVSVPKVKVHDKYDDLNDLILGL